MSAAVEVAEGVRRFRPYPQYKQSGVDWLGEIPIQWETTRVSDRSDLINGFPFDSERFSMDQGWPLVRIRDLESHETEIRYDGPLVEAARIRRGDVLIGMDGDFNVARWGGGDALLNQRMCCLRTRSSLNNQYLRFAIQFPLQVINDLTYSTTVKHLSSGQVKKIRLAFPPLAEQRAIAEFLDRETGKIDALVAKKERLIELLEEKRTALITHAVTKGLDPTAPTRPSGIDWLGHIPAHWSAAKVTYRYHVQLGKMLDQSKITGENLFPYLRVVDVQWGRINVADLPVMDFVSHEQQRFRLRPGDLIVNEGGSYVGRSAIWNGQLKDCFYQKALHRVRARGDQDTTRFLYYVMLFATKQGVFIAGGNQTTIDHLTAEQLNSYRLAFPPLAEQVQIADYLDNRNSELERLVFRVQDAIERLQEFRTALISAAVTGKIDVREEAGVVPSDPLAEAPA